MGVVDKEKNRGKESVYLSLPFEKGKERSHQPEWKVAKVSQSCKVRMAGRRNKSCGRVRKKTWCLNKRCDFNWPTAIWPTRRMASLLTGQVVNWPASFLVLYWSTSWLGGWSTYQFVGLPIASSLNWPTNWLANYLTGQLLDWPTCQRLKHNKAEAVTIVSVAFAIVIIHWTWMLRVLCSIY